jgi:mannose-6-phosphate isomerase-like protein (cupin superfamily)
LGAATIPLEDYDGSMEWYEQYGRRFESDGREGRLVLSHSFAESWTTWEVHPAGEELVVCLKGSFTAIQEIDGGERRTLLREGQAVINPPGCWHTVDTDGPATAFFVTAGLGTDHRPR